MGFLLPSIMRKIDEFLLVKQLNAKILCHGVRGDLLMMATASPLAGNDYDYERLELLGMLRYTPSRIRPDPPFQETPSLNICLASTFSPKTLTALKASCTRQGRCTSATSNCAVPPIELVSQDIFS